MKKKQQNKQFVRVDKQLLLIKQGDIYTAAKKKQIYKIRIVQWGKYQAVLQKRLFVFSENLMDYVPGRLMALNLNDMEAIIYNQDKIMKILGKAFDQLQVEKTYKQKIIEMNKKNDEKTRGE